MIRHTIRLAFFVAGLAVFTHSAWSDQKNEELDELFFRLHETTDMFEAASLSRDIWKNWYQNSNPDIEALMKQGEISMQRADYPDAVQLYTQVIKLDPDFAEGWNRRATVLYLMGEFQLSTNDVVETLKLEPRHYGALSGQGLIYLQLQERRLALEYFEKALEANPHMSNVRENIEMLKKLIDEEVI